MTTNQLSNLNINLKPSSITINQLSSNETIRNQLIYFFFKLKNNYDNYQKNLDICPVKINWTITNPSTSNVLNFDSGDSISSVLAVELYKYILKTNDTSNFIAYVKEAFRINNLLKKQAYRYFKRQNCCDTQTISNYNRYYLMQSNRYIGNR